MSRLFVNVFYIHIPYLFFDLNIDEEKVMMALKMILGKVNISGITFVLDIKEDTILFWLDQAYKKADELNQALFKKFLVTRVELDKMWSGTACHIGAQSRHQLFGKVEPYFQTISGTFWT